jgi:type I restriction enzyme, R subunit
MVVDECHRGYLLDREMSDQELEFRSQDDKYRRVLEHFDAVKIGLTATSPPYGANLRRSDFHLLLPRGRD